MASYKTVPVTEKQFKEIIKVLQHGAIINNKTKARIEANPTIALLLTVQGNLGLRIGDMLRLTMNSFKTIIYADDTQGFYIDIKEEKTDKQRNKQVHPAIYNLLLDYTTKQQITSNKPIFQVSVRTVQNKLKKGKMQNAKHQSLLHKDLLKSLQNKNISESFSSNYL